MRNCTYCVYIHVTQTHYGLSVTYNVLYIHVTQMHYDLSVL